MSAGSVDALVGPVVGASRLVLGLFAQRLRAARAGYRGEFRDTVVDVTQTARVLVVVCVRVVVGVIRRCVLTRRVVGRGSVRYGGASGGGARRRRTRACAVVTRQRTGARDAGHVTRGPVLPPGAAAARADLLRLVQMLEQRVGEGHGETDRGLRLYTRVHRRTAVTVAKRLIP